MSVRMGVYPTERCLLHMGLRQSNRIGSSPFGGAGRCPSLWLSVHPNGRPDVRGPVGRRPAHPPGPARGATAGAPSRFRRRRSGASSRPRRVRAPSGPGRGPRRASRWSPGGPGPTAAPSIRCAGRPAAGGTRPGSASPARRRSSPDWKPDSAASSISRYCGSRRDARVGAQDPLGDRAVLGLLGERDAERRVGRALHAELGDPDRRGPAAARRPARARGATARRSSRCRDRAARRTARGGWRRGGGPSRRCAASRAARAKDPAQELQRRDGRGGRRPARSRRPAWCRRSGRRPPARARRRGAARGRAPATSACRGRTAA